MKRLLKVMVCLGVFVLCSRAYATELQVNTVYPQKLLTDTQVVTYRIVLDKPGVLMLQTEHAEILKDESYWVLRISDQHLQVLSEISVPGDITEFSGPRLRLPAGTYEMRLTSGTSFSNTELKVSFVFQDESELHAEREPNQTRETATPLELNRVMLGNIEQSGDVDIYSVHIAEPGRLVVQLESNRQGSVHVWEVALSTSSEPEAAHIALDDVVHRSKELLVSEQTYFLHVGAVLENVHDQDYRLVARFQPGVPDIAPTALEVGELYEGVFVYGQEKQEFGFEYTGSSDNTWGLVVQLNSLDPRALWEMVLFDSDLEQVGYSTTHERDFFICYNRHESLPVGSYVLTLQPITEMEEGQEYSYTLELLTSDTFDTRIVMQIDNPEMLVNGVLQEIDPGYATAPVLLSNATTVVPIRTLIEVLGGNISWDSSTQQVRIEYRGHVLVLTIDDDQALGDGKVYPLSTSPRIIDGRTMLPLRFVSQMLGCFVDWYQETLEIVIRT